MSASLRYLYKSGSSFLKWRSNDEGALEETKQKLTSKDQTRTPKHYKLVPTWKFLQSNSLFSFPVYTSTKECYPQYW